MYLGKPRYSRRSVWPGYAALPSSEVCFNNMMSSAVNKLAYKYTKEIDSHKFCNNIEFKSYSINSKRILGQSCCSFFCHLLIVLLFFKIGTFNNTFVFPIRNLQNTLYIFVWFENKGFGAHINSFGCEVGNNGFGLYINCRLLLRWQQWLWLHLNFMVVGYVICNKCHLHWPTYFGWEVANILIHICILI